MLPLIEEFKQKLLREYKNATNMTNIISACFMLEDWLCSDQMDKISPKDVDRFKTYLMTEYVTRNGTCYKKSAVIAKLVGLKRYFAFLVENKAIAVDPARNLEIPKKRMELPSYLPTEEEIWELINKVDTSTPEGMRNKAAIALMLVAPLKNKEAEDFTIDQVGLANRCIYPKKGSKEISVPMPDPIFEILNRYITKERYHLIKWLKIPTDLLFVNRWGKPFASGTLNVIFGKYNKYSPRERRIYPGLMRKTVANHMRKKGLQPNDMQKILGIKIDTVRTYTTLARNEMKAEEERWLEKIPLFKDFKEKLFKDGLYPNVIDKALKAVIFFAKFLKSEDMKNITTSDIARCKDYIMNEYLSHYGKRLREDIIVARLRALKHYFSFLYESGYLTSDPASDLEIPKAGPRLKWYQPTKENIEEFASKPDQYSYAGIRDCAIIRLWHAAPLKTREYKDLRIEDIDLGKRIVSWLGSKRGHLSLDEKTCKVIERYLKVSRPVFAKKSKIPTDKLFLNEWGDPFCGTSIYEVFWKYKGDKYVRPYAGRHIRAIEMLRKGKSIEEVKKTLGLKSKRICQAYEMLVADDTTNFYKKGRFEDKVKLLKRQKPMANITLAV